MFCVVRILMVYSFDGVSKDRVGSILCFSIDC